MTSSLRSGRRISTISGSLRGSLVARAWFIVVISPLSTILPSFVIGTHSAILISLHVALDLFYHLLDGLVDMFPGYPIIGWEHIIAMRYIDAGIKKPS